MDSTNHGRIVSIKSLALISPAEEASNADTEEEVDAADMGYQNAKQDYEDYREEYEQAKEEPSFQLDNEEQKRLKSLYR